MSDKEEYLRKLKEDIAAQHAKDTRTQQDFINNKFIDTDAELLAHVEILDDPVAVRKAMDLLTNRNADLKLRMLAPQKAIAAIGANSDYIQICMSLLSDTGEPEELRKAVLTLLATLIFSSGIFNSQRAAYLSILRTLLDDDSSSLREMAAAELAKVKDGVVQERLLKGLKGEATPIVSTIMAMQLLGFDLHAEQFPVVKKILQNPATDEPTKLQAIRILGNDPDSRQLLVDLMLDKNQPGEIRMTSAASIQVSHPESFIKLAKPILLDETESNDVQAVVLTGLLLNHDKAAVYDDEKFLNQLQQVSLLNATVPTLRKMSDRLIKKTTIERKSRKD
ncbi:MAG: hypothetical protein ABI151_04155 [Chitinophagaceae bacterium]